MLRVLSIAHRFRYREIVLEVDLGRGDESGAHEDAEDGEADRVVLLPCVRAAGMLREGGAVVQREREREMQRDLDGNRMERFTYPRPRLAT